MSMLIIDQLEIYRRDVAVLSIGHAELQAGEIIAVLGPNGAGKSSLLKAISSQWLADSGSIHLHDKALHEWPRRERARHVGVLPQSSELSFPFSAQEVVAIGATPLSLDSSQIREQSLHWMHITDTLPFADRIYTSLSGGERQRVQLARILLQLSSAEKPPLLLLDEPTSAQDLGQQHHLLQLIRQLSQQQNTGVIMILHDLNQAMRYADKIWLLKEGKMIASGAPETILQPDRIEQIWGYCPELLSSKDGHQVLI